MQASQVSGGNGGEVLLELALGRRIAANPGVHADMDPGFLLSAALVGDTRVVKVDTSGERVDGRSPVFTDVGVRLGVVSKCFPNQNRGHLRQELRGLPCNLQQANGDVVAYSASDLLEVAESTSERTGLGHPGCIAGGLH